MGHLFNLLLLIFICFISSKAEDYESIFSTTTYPNNTKIESKRFMKLLVQDNHKPTFTECPGNATVKEEQSRGTHVLTVTATDIDPRENGGFITYSILKREGDRDYFSVNNVTGEITTQVIFDRDDTQTQKERFITVKATDNGRPILEDLCTIKITILDINDNAPIFDKAINEAQVSEDLKPNGEVMRILAYDLDDGDNSRLTYSFENSVKDFEKYFRIDSNTGVIYLKETLTGKRGTQFQSNVKVNDNPTNREEQQKYSTAEIKIMIVDSKKQPPTISVYPQNITLLENYTDVSTPLFHITAKSNIKNSDVQFELLKGQTRQTNSENTFLLNSNGSEAVITVARLLDYETVTDYRLTVRVTNTDSLNAIATLMVNVEDVNDEFPSFIELVSGSVLENEDAGTEVMVIKAIDKDITSPNNLVTYTLESHTDLFDINPNTGRVTTKEKFDREEIEIYQIKVTAKDGAPSSFKNTGEPNSNSQTFRVKIEDKNDNKPVFTQAIYFPEPIPEDVDEGKDVIEVKANDKDTASLIEYSIINGNVGDAFYIENTTGRIKVKNKLDYETIESYNLTVKAFDGFFSDECEVHIQISNVNDELPRFEPVSDTRIIIQEESIPIGCIITVQAYDPDIKDRNADQKIVYRIGEEQRKFADVNKTGCVTLKKALDRDRPNGAKEYQVYIHAYDDDDGPNSKSHHLEIFIVLEDINDNAPFLNITEVVWYENQVPGDIVKLTADDYDSENNSAPFVYTLAVTANDDIRSKLSITNDILRANVKFDREEQKYYDIPIGVTDSGTPPQTATSILRLIIGDINDNEAQNGSSEIFVYNYKGSYPNIDIGRVYVEDKDDWDLDDKIFQWENFENRNFLLNNNNGTITMIQGTGSGVYELKFRVTEESAWIDKHEVYATVTITVKDIPEEAVRKSGSIRMRGTSTEEFVTKDYVSGKSPKEILHSQLSKILNATMENVDIFTVVPSIKNNSYYVDVRFSAHGSPYYLPERLNDKVSEHESELQDKLNVEFVMISINECFDENTCTEKRSCTNELHIDNRPAVVFTNKTSFVGVKAIVEPTCGSGEITITYCYNGGTYTETGTCICPDGFDGPYCEMLGIGFRGDGWALYRSFEAFERTNIRLEISAEKDDGLIFYIGPTNIKPEPIVRDFMSLELRGGFPILLLNYGSETIKSVVPNKKLSDGHVHSISILLTNKSIELRVDDSPGSDGQAINEPQNTSVLLNVNGPLQVGGTKSSLNKLAEKLHWEEVPTLKGFSGCVRNFTYNSYTYNLGQPAVFKNAIPNCNYGVSTAVFGIDSNFLVAILVCAAILIILLLAVVVHRRKHDSWPEKDTDDIRETIISYEDEGGGEGDTAYDLTVLRGASDDIIEKDKLYKQGAGDVPNIGRFLEGKKNVCDHDPNNLPYDNVRYYAYEGDGNSTGSLSSLASCTDDGDLKFNYLSSFGPRFRKLADMYGEPPNSDDDSNAGGEESWI